MCMKLYVSNFTNTKKSFHQHNSYSFTKIQKIVHQHTFFTYIFHHYSQVLWPFEYEIIQLLKLSMIIMHNMIDQSFWSKYCECLFLTLYFLPDWSSVRFQCNHFTAVRMIASNLRMQIKYSQLKNFKCWSRLVADSVSLKRSLTWQKSQITIYFMWFSSLKLTDYISRIIFYQV